MADIGEEAAFKSVQFDELTIGFFQIGICFFKLTFVLIKLVTKNKFLKTQSGRKMVANSYDDAGGPQEKEIAKHHRHFDARTFPNTNCCVESKHATNCNYGFSRIPAN